MKLNLVTMNNMQKKKSKDKIPKKERKIIKMIVKEMLI